MKIALVNNFHPYTGIGKYAFNLFERLHEEKDVEMIYLESKDNKTEARSGMKKIVQRLHAPVYNRTLSWYYYFPKKIPGGYDVYHVSSQYLAKVAKYRRPCVVSHMDIAPLLFPGDYPLVLRLLLKKVLKEYENADSIVTISEGSKQELIQHGFANEEKVKVIPLGYDERIFKPLSKDEARKKLGLPPDKKIVLHVGSEEKRKDMPTLLGAVKEVKKEISDVLFVRVGPTSSEYGGMKKGLNMREFRNIPESDMPWFYNSADVFVFPSTYEGGFAYPPLEAMACGIPTIVTQELGMFKNGVHIIPPGGVAELADAIKGILTEPETYRRLSEAAIKEAALHTLTIQVNETYSAYEKFLGR